MDTCLALNWPRGTKTEGKRGAEPQPHTIGNEQAIKAHVVAGSAGGGGFLRQAKNRKPKTNPLANYKPQRQKTTEQNMEATHPLLKMVRVHRQGAAALLPYLAKISSPILQAPAASGRIKQYQGCVRLYCAQNKTRKLRPSAVRRLE